jgi:2-oxoglutarate ferredoxin oxidoreductase subunit alpha
MIGLDPEKIHAALSFHFKGKQKPIDMNLNTVKVAAEWAKANLEKKDPFWLEPMNKTDGLIMADGNTAAAIGSIFGGVQFAAWYPITPASSLAEALNDYLPVLRKREDGKQTYAVLQAEDELAAIGMAIGAGWSGLRSMTSTSGPGLSLMTEFAGLAYCGGSCRGLGCAADRTQHRPADPDFTRRPDLHQFYRSRGYSCCHPSTGQRG